MGLVCLQPTPQYAKNSFRLLSGCIEEKLVSYAVQKHLYPGTLLLFPEAFYRLLDTVPRLMYPTTGKSCVTIG